MKKQIKYFLVMLLFFVLVGTSYVNAAEFAPTDSNIAETSNEEVIYIIGTHLFTEETDYISAQLMMYAARTIELPDGIDEEEALKYMKIYTRDWEGNWTDAINGKPVTFENGFKFDIKYTDLEKYVVTYANVTNVTEMEEALANPDIQTINIMNDFTTDHSIVISKPVTINGNDKTISFEEMPAEWVTGGNNYVLKVYNTEATINGIKLTNSRAGLWVGSSDVTLKGTIDVSGNKEGGIEVSKSTDYPDRAPSLNAIDATLVNDGEASLKATIWEDKVTGTVETNLVKVTGLMPNQVLYYNEMPEATVTSLAELQLVLGSNLKVINLANDITTDASIEIGRSVTINGNGNKIAKSGTPAFVSGGDNYVLKVYGGAEAIDVEIVNIGLTNAMAAMIVGDNARVLVDGLDVSGNVWGGIEVKNVATAELVVGGENNGIIHSNETYGVPTVWVDETTVANQVATVTLVGATKIETKGQVHYYQQEGVANGNSEEAIKDALADENVTTIIIPTEVEVDEPIVVDREIVLQGEGTITLSDNAAESGADALTVTTEGKIIIPAGSRILVERLENSGEIIIGYTPAIYAMRSLAEPTVVDAMLSVIEPMIMTETGKITNNGTLLVKENGSITGAGTITNNGIIRLSGDRTFGAHIGVYVEGEGTVEQWVATEAQLQLAIADVMVDTVVLDGDIVLTSATVGGIEVAREVTLEMNGCTIDSTNVATATMAEKQKSYAFIVREGGNLTINGEGTFTSAKDADYKNNILNDAGTLTLNNVTLVGNYCVDTNLRGSTKPAETTMTGCTLTGGFASATGWSLATVNVDNSTLTGKWYAVTGNGTAQDATLNITNGSVLTGTEGVAIYMPSTKILNVTDSTLTGLTALEAVAGEISIVNSKLNATGAYKDFATLEAKTSDGTYDEGSAIFLRSHGGYADEGTLRLTIDDKTTLTSANGNGIRIYEQVNKTQATQGVSEILVGYYPKNITAGKDKEAVKVEAKDLITYVEVDDLSVEGEKYVFTEAGLQSAIADANVDTVILGADIALTSATVGGIEVTREVTLEMNGYTIDSTNGATAEIAGHQKSYAFIVKGGIFTINGEGKFTTAKDTSYKNNILNDAGTLYINNVTLEGNYCVDTNLRGSTEIAETTMTGCTLTSPVACTTGWSYATVNIDNSDLTATWYAVAGNGTAESATLNITNGSELTSTSGSAIYMPGTKKLNITDSTVTGLTAIEAVAGEISIENSTISATGDYKDLATLEAKTGDGTYTEGSAIFLRSHEGYADGSELTLTVDNKSTISSANAHGIRVYEHVGKTESTQGVSTITVNYYSDKVTSTKDALMVEDAESLITTVETTDLAE